MVAYGVDHGVDALLNVVKGNGKPPTPPLLLPESAQKSRLNGTKKFYFGLFFRILSQNRNRLTVGYLDRNIQIITYWSNFMS